MWVWRCWGGERVVRVSGMLGRRSLSRETGMPVVMICPAEHKTTTTHRLDHSDPTGVLPHRSGRVNRWLDEWR